MEKRIFKKIKAYTFIIVITLPLWILLLSVFRTGNMDLTAFDSICGKVSIPFINEVINGLADIFNITNDNSIILFFTYFMSTYLLYLILDLLILVLDMIHNVFHTLIGGKKNAKD